MSSSCLGSSGYLHNCSCQTPPFVSSSPASSIYFQDPLETEMVGGHPCRYILIRVSERAEREAGNEFSFPELQLPCYRSPPLHWHLAFSLDWEELLQQDTPMEMWVKEQRRYFPSDKAKTGAACRWTAVPLQPIEGWWRGPLLSTLWPAPV